MRPATATQHLHLFDRIGTGADVAPVPDILQIITGSGLCPAAFYDGYSNCYRMHTGEQKNDRNN